MKRILLPGVTALLAVVSFVALSGWNRSGEPRQQITLTERELAMPSGYPSAAPGDDPGLHLGINVEYRSGALDARNWLPEDRLREIGFPLDVPAGAPDAQERYRRALPRIAWVVFEYGGDAWREIDRRLTLWGRERGMMTRLVPVDAGLDWDALLAQYPTGHLILRATLALNYLDAADGGPLVFGSIRQLHPSEVTVPRALRDRLAGLASDQSQQMDRSNAQPPATPRYEVDVAVGRLGIPYIWDVRLLQR